MGSWDLAMSLVDQPNLKLFNTHSRTTKYYSPLKNKNRHVVTRYLHLTHDPLDFCSGTNCLEDMHQIILIDII